MFISTYY